ncbi:hypothetical protein Agub_g4746, partial [Astrephomene gubernaculifera]
FEFFLENNIMLYLHRVLQQPANRTGDVAKQVLQTLSIIIQNIRSETGTYFLFSNNHINNIVEIRFDFEDEEVLGYYISFLKTISLKLNAGTVQFFFDGRDSEYTFPLYSEAVKFAHHKEGMVRAGVRTLTLNVYSVPDPYIQEYVCRPPATSYVAEMVGYIADQVKILDKRMATAEGFSAQVLSSLDSQLAEVEDMVSYVADILTTAPPRLAHLVAQQLWVGLVGPCLLRPLLGGKGAKPETSGSRGSGGGSGLPNSPRGQMPPVRAACSLYCLERLFMLITYPPLLHNLALALLDPRVGHPSCRSAVEALLRSQEHHSVSAALRCLVALVHNRHMAPEVMALLGLVPRQRAADLHRACSARDCAACRLREQLPPLPQGCMVPGMPPDPLAEQPLPVATSAAAGGGGGSEMVFAYHVIWTRMEDPARRPLAPQERVGSSGIDSDGVSRSSGDAPGEAGLLGGGEERQERGTGGMDASTAEAQAGPASSDSLPAVIPFTSATQLEYSVAAPGRGSGGEDAGTSGADLLSAGESGGVLQPQPSEPQSQGPQEADLLGLGDLATAPSGGADTIPANAATNTDAPMQSDASRSAVAPVDVTVDLLDMRLEAVPGEPETQPSIPAGDLSAAANAEAASPPGAVTGPPADAIVTDDGADAQSASVPVDELSAAFADSLTVAESATTEAPSSSVSPAVAEMAAAPIPATASKEAEGGPLSSLLDMLPQAAAAAAAVAATALASTSAALGDPLGASNPVAAQPTGPSSSDLASISAPDSSTATATTQLSEGVTAPSQPASGAAAAPHAPPDAPAADPPPAPVPEPVVGPPCTLHVRPAALASSSDLLDALFSLLSTSLLPVSGLWNVGLLLAQLYPRAEERRQLEDLLRRQQEQQQQDGLQTTSSGSPADQTADLLGVGEQAEGVLAAAAAPDSTPDHAAPPAPPAPSLPEPPAAPHPLDPSSTAGWACQLSAAQREALRVAAVSAASAVLDEVGGMWCDALMAMMALEWPAAHDAVTRPSLRASAEQLMAGPHLYPRQHARALSGTSRNDQGLSGSAVAALHSYHAVSRLVALLHLHQLLQRGATGRKPPPTCPVPQSGDVEGREWDVQEGQEVELEASSAIPCIVSFAPGQERRVYFAAAGPALRRVTEYLHDPQMLLADPAAQAIVLHSSPAVVLADPAPTRLNAGVVLSVSPLLGSEPGVDKNVAKWLHVHVRPSVRGLLRLLRSAAAGRKGGLLAALRHLADGHWVLAFPDAERAASAKQLVEQSAHRLRALYCELLSPVLGEVME